MNGVLLKTPNIIIARMIARYTIQRSTTGLLDMNCRMVLCSCIRWTNSMNAMTPTATIRDIHFAPIWMLSCANVRLVKRCVRMYQASAIEFALKKIQAIVTTEKVNTISIRWVNFGSLVILVMLKNACFSGFVRRSMIKSAPWMAPHTTKVHDAPCHNPDNKKTIAILRCHPGIDTLFPPNGM